MKITLKEKYLSSSQEVSFIIFEIDGEFQFKEGQFVMLSAELNGEPIKRAYSIATPGYLTKENKIGFVIKKTSEYGMSKFLTQDIQIGDSIEMMGPYGHLTNDFSKDHYLFVSVGSGLGPILSHYNCLIKSGNYKKIANVFGERNYANIVPEYEKTFHSSENTKNYLFLSQEDNIPQGYSKGYIQSGIDDALNFLETTDIKVIICGKPQMADEVVEILTKKGIPVENIKAEKY